MNATMRYLTIEQREKLQERLRALIEQLRGEITQGRKLPNHNEETDDEAVADVETAIEIAEIERATLTLRKAVGALELLHSPGYGLCTACGAEIPFVRLQANPATTRCVACQREHERGAPQPARL